MINKIRRKSENGITLITLMLTVLILVIITSTLVAKSYSNMQLSRLTKLDNDIKALNDRVAAYYVGNDELPVKSGNIYTKTTLSSTISGLATNDGEKYYEIDLAELYGVTSSEINGLSLNYGKGSSSTDIYVINEDTHIIYYLKGVTYQGDMYYTTGNSS